MTHPETNAWLHRFAVLTALATLALIGLGGLVTSHEAGMSVPDWPTSYGYNMFLFPLSHWWHAGNIFYEHSHRLFASGVGLLTTILAVWLWWKEPRSWLRWLGVAAFIAVVVQGVLGGLRVVWLKDEIGIFHATLAQLFFLLLCSIALFTSRWWKKFTAALESGPAASTPVAPAARHWIFVTTALILLQLILGAAMRHQHAGLAIPDFPLAYGKLWPATDDASIARYNQQRVETSGINAITAAQIHLQMAHRINAIAILAAVIGCTWRLRKRPPVSSGNLPGQRLLLRGSIAWLALILAQAGLGAATVLTDKAADIATAHVLVGALSLAIGGIMCIISARSPELKRDARALSSDLVPA